MIDNNLKELMIMNDNTIEIRIVNNYSLPL